MTVTMTPIHLVPKSCGYPKSITKLTLNGAAKIRYGSKLKKLDLNLDLEQNILDLDLDLDSEKNLILI